MECCVKNDKLYVSLATIEQIFDCPYSKITGFGNVVMVESPFIFVNAPFEDTGGTIYIYKIHENQYRKKYVQLHCTVTRSKYQTSISDNEVGFGFSFQFESGYLFIIDTSRNGSLCYHCVFPRGNFGLLYAEPNDLLVLKKIAKIETSQEIMQRRSIYSHEQTIQKTTYIISINVMSKLDGLTSTIKIECCEIGVDKKLAFVSCSEFPMCCGLP